MSSASGAAVATDKAIPRLNAAVVRAFMTVTSLGRNHCINRGPVAVRMKANPRPVADLRSTRAVKLGAHPDNETRATAVQPMMNALRRPMRAIRTPLGNPKAAAIRRGNATKSPAVARLTS